MLDAVNQIQATQANDLACRWNCKAGKCGSCSAEINGMPKLMCMTRLSELPLEKPVTVQPMKAFPVIKDLITDVSWNFRVKKKIKKFKPRPLQQNKQHFTISRHASPRGGFLFFTRYGSLNSPACSCVSITLPDAVSEDHCRPIHVSFCRCCMRR